MGPVVPLPLITPPASFVTVLPVRQLASVSQKTVSFDCGCHVSRNSDEPLAALAMFSVPLHVAWNTLAEL